MLPALTPVAFANQTRQITSGDKGKHVTRHALSQMLLKLLKVSAATLNKLQVIAEKLRGEIKCSYTIYCV
jgi:hypothetical protein